MARVWNALDQSNGLLIQSSPAGFGLVWIRKLQILWILDWTGFRKKAVTSGMYFLKAEHNGNACHSEICRLSFYCRNSRGLSRSQIHNVSGLDWIGSEPACSTWFGLDSDRSFWIWIGLDCVEPIHFILWSVVMAVKLAISTAAPPHWHGRAQPVMAAAAPCRPLLSALTHFCSVTAGPLLALPVRRLCIG